jgi:uncharacterized protein (DUF488 family)
VSDDAPDTSSPADRRTLFTIGHSDHDLAAFVALLHRHGIDAVADVRSSPYGRYHVQFNREPLAEGLKRAGVKYVFLGRELGARREERETYVGRQARYDRVRTLPLFKEGLDRVRRGMATRRVALMCAEKDPITCHRMVLVCRELRGEPIDVMHVLHDGSLETTEQAESRLLEEVGLPPADLFSSRAELVERAYEIQAGRIAYTEPDPAAAANDGGPA